MISIVFFQQMLSMSKSSLRIPPGNIGLQPDAPILSLVIHLGERLEMWQMIERKNGTK
jgi:hypothetical protein